MSSAAAAVATALSSAQPVSSAAALVAEAVSESTPIASGRALLQALAAALPTEESPATLQDSLAICEHAVEHVRCVGCGVALGEARRRRPLLRRNEGAACSPARAVCVCSPLSHSALLSCAPRAAQPPAGGV